MKFLLYVSIFALLSCEQKGSKQKESNFIESVLNHDTTLQVSNIQSPNSSNTEELVSEIRVEYKRINSLLLTKKIFNWRCEDLEMHGTVKYLLEKNQIVKIVEDGYYIDGFYTTEYYYKEGKFIFRYDTNTSGPGNDMRLQKSENRTYAKNDIIIRTMVDKIVTKAEREKLTSSSQEYLIFEAYTSKNCSSVLCDFYSKSYFK